MCVCVYIYKLCVCVCVLRDNDGKHQLVSRSDAKKNFLLKDCDLDLREPPLRCILRKNPHNPRWGDMKLYLRTQVGVQCVCLCVRAYVLFMVKPGIVCVRLCTRACICAWFMVKSVHACVYMCVICGSGFVCVYMCVV